MQTGVHAQYIKAHACAHKHLLHTGEALRICTHYIPAEYFLLFIKLLLLSLMAAEELKPRVYSNAD